MKFRLLSRLMFCALPAVMFCATAWAQPFSQYGVIQNVHNYSTNPFWNPNAPYNQRVLPILVDARPDLDAGDCDRTVTVLVTWLCDANNKCDGMQLADVRPQLMIQLSQLPGHNYATACAGFIDSAFQKYMQNESGTVPAVAVPFPTPVGPTAVEFPTVTVNPYAEKIPDWQVAEQERAQQLKAWQAQNE